MKKAAIIIFTILSIAVTGWMNLCYEARNTYFRPIWYELDETPNYRYQFCEHSENRERNPGKRYYFMAIERGQVLAKQIYYPAVILNLLGLLLIWRLGWDRKKKQDG